MKVITINVSETDLKIIQDLIDLGIVPSRSEAIRHAIRKYIPEIMQGLLTCEKLIKTHINTKVVKRLVVNENNTIEIDGKTLRILGEA